MAVALTTFATRKNAKLDSRLAGRLLHEAELRSLNGERSGGEADAERRW